MLTKPPLTLTPGTLIDQRYRLEACIGEGGFASVYRARHIHMDRLAALKILHTQGSGPQAQQFEARFLLEAQALARLNHPNIVSVYDFGFHGQERLPYLAMELLEGHDLEAEIQRGPLPFARAKRLLLPTLEALGKAHALKIVHKDLKPSNIFILEPGTPQEQAKVLDFGIARIDGNNKQTQTGLVFGTPQYLSPEYIEGQIVSPALDVYQMGLILVEVLTGAAVLSETNPLQCVAVHLRGGLEIPEPLLSSPLGDILRQALAMEPQHRFADASALAAALSTIEPALVPAVTPATPRRSINANSGGFLPALVSLVPAHTTAPHTGELATTQFVRERAEDEASAAHPANAHPSLPPGERLTGARTPTVALAEATPSFQEARNRASQQPTQALALAPPQQSSKLLFVGLALLLLAGALAGLAWTLRPQDPSPEPPPTSLIAPLPSAPSPPREIIASITSEPPGAEVFYEDKRLGITPLSWPHAPQALTATLTLLKPGFEPRTIRVDQSEPGAWEVELRAVAPAPTTAAPPATAPVSAATLPPQISRRVAPPTSRAAPRSAAPPQSSPSPARRPASAPPTRPSTAAPATIGREL